MDSVKTVAPLTKFVVGIVMYLCFLTITKGHNCCKFAKIVLNYS